VTGLVGAVVEAWDELRIHKLRVLLALVGVAVAVCALTGMTAVGQIVREASAEFTQRMSGRPATFQVAAWSPGPSGPTAERYDQVFTDVVDRYDVTYASRRTDTMLRFRFPTGTQDAQVTVVDPDFGTMHRVEVVTGSWFDADDADRLAPALVVNEDFLAQLGIADLSGDRGIVLSGATPVRTTVIGVVPNQWKDEGPHAYLLTDAFRRWATPPAEFGPSIPVLELWVPPAAADGLQTLVRRDVGAALPGTEVDVSRSDSAGYDSIDRSLQWIIAGVGGVALLLGGLGLLNISLVTVRHRIQEIGIRRSFGASSGRVFFSVLMESVVATVVAGVVGVGLAIVILDNVPVEALTPGGAVSDLPPFPVEAAVVGILAAAAIGALAGLIPAVVAVRVKVIDAIRY
jgi:putative ABC transport system permease protein